MKIMNYYLSTFIWVLVFLSFESNDKCYSQSLCYSINGNFATFSLSCGKMTVYHTHTRIEADFSIRISDIHHTGTGKRHPEDPALYLFIFMDKDENEFYAIMQVTDEEARQLQKDLH